MRCTCCVEWIECIVYALRIPDLHVCCASPDEDLRRRRGAVHSERVFKSAKKWNIEPQFRKQERGAVTCGVVKVTLKLMRRLGFLESCMPHDYQRARCFRELHGIIIWQLEPSSC